MMKRVKDIIFILAMVTGLAFSVTAQKNDDQRKPPPKNTKPPVINPGDKKPPRPAPSPREDKKPKKPMSEYSIILPRKVEDKV